MHITVDALMSKKIRMAHIPNSAQMPKGLIASKSRLQRVRYQKCRAFADESVRASTEPTDPTRPVFSMMFRTGFDPAWKLFGV
jgi:hypothetical protein